MDRLERPSESGMSELLEKDSERQHKESLASQARQIINKEFRLTLVEMSLYTIYKQCGVDKSSDDIRSTAVALDMGGGFTQIPTHKVAYAILDAPTYISDKGIGRSIPIVQDFIGAFEEYHYERSYTGQEMRKNSPKFWRSHRESEYLQATGLPADMPMEFKTLPRVAGFKRRYAALKEGDYTAAVKGLPGSEDVLALGASK